MVIIGSGFAGGVAAYFLRRDSRFSVTVIDSKNFFENTPSIPHLITHPADSANLLVPHKTYLTGRETFIHAQVTSISKDGRSIELSNGKKVEGFDYLLLATGSSYTAPVKGVFNRDYLPFRIPMLMNTSGEVLYRVLC